MHARLFSAQHHRYTSAIEISIEWQPLLTPELKKAIIATHLTSFLDLYQPYSEQQLGLLSGLSKKTWLTRMIRDDLEEVKSGRMFLAVAYIQDSLAGYITCQPVTARHEDLKTDVYISLLATRQFKNMISGDKISLGIGRQLIESAASRFPDANTLTLDTRLINQAAMAFYQHLNFNGMGRRTFGGSNPDYYVGYEKPIKR